jgi:hypothetical protein
MDDNTANRLRDLDYELLERLAEAEAVRARYVSAQRANNWPDLRSTSQPFSDERANEESPSE